MEKRKQATGMMNSYIPFLAVELSENLLCKKY